MVYLNASWMYDYWQKIDDVEVNNMILAELPVFKTNDVYFGRDSIHWAVPKNSLNKEEAIKFLLYINNKDVTQKWFNYTKCPSGIKGKLSAVSLGQNYFQDFTYNIDKKYGAKKLSVSYVNNGLVVGLSKINTDFHVIDVATGKMSADEAMEDIKAQLKKGK